MQLLLVLIMLPFLCAAQVTYQGILINKINKVAVPFATVGLINENIGTTALEDGTFTLRSQKGLNNDTLIISCVGYTTLKLPISQLFLRCS